jgi:hypothetical protein
MPYLSNEPTLAWAKDGSAVAIASTPDGLSIYDIAGRLQGEVYANAFRVEWLAYGTLLSHMRPGGVTGDEGNAVINPATGAVDHFTPSHLTDIWSPDGRRLAYVRHGSFLTDPIGTCPTAGIASSMTATLTRFRGRPTAPVWRRWSRAAEGNVSVWPRSMP